MFAIRFKIPYTQVDATIEKLSVFFSTLTCFEDKDSGESGLFDHDGFPVANLFDVEVITQDKTQAHLISYIFGETISLNITQIENQDWLKLCYQNFKPICVEQFFIHSSYAPEQVPEGMIGLKIDAATAFGSGEHQTTKGCLSAMHHLMMNHKIHDILDMGCGSGILGLCAALKNNEAIVLGVDIDENATQVANNNAILNNVPNFRAITSTGFERLSMRPYDLIIANILARPLIDMAYDMFSFLKPNGYIILSGLIERQQNDVLNAYKALGFTCISVINIESWLTITLKKEETDT
jgi:ribosomal protein L11 methyltransferase